MTIRALHAPLLALGAAFLLGWGTGVVFAAGPPQTGSGTGQITSFQITSSRQAGPNVIQERVLEGTIDGTLQGTFVETVSGVIHQNGRVTFHGILDFTGSVQGCGEGSFQAALSGQGRAGVPITDATFRTISQGSNTLSVTGTGRLHQEGPNFTYEVNYMCR